MSTHMQGPWEVSDGYVQQSGHPDVGICQILCVDEDGRGQYVGGPVTEANAHLIAAAPDLYEALLDMVSGCDALFRNQPCPFDETVNRARAALAKAEGKS